VANKYPTVGASRRGLLTGASLRTLVIASAALAAGTMVAPSSRAATVIGDQTSAYTLTPGGDNSFVINAGTTITSPTHGIIGGSSVGYWTINNAGTINVQDEGFYLLATTNLTNSGSVTSQTSIAVDLLAGGAFINTSAGVVTGAAYGFRSEGYGTVTNAGSISGGAEGANIAYGTLTNQVGATISASETNSSGVFLAAGGALVNAGAISTTGTGNAAGVTLAAGGSVTNQSGGTITSGAYGIFVANSSGVTTITNAGTITGGNKQAVLGDSPNGNLSLNNQGGVINGDVELLGGSNTVDDSGGGQINGNVTFSGSGNRLITDFGSASSPIVGISGSVSGGSNNSLQLDLTTNLTLSGAVILPSDFQTLVFGLGNGANLTVASGATLSNTVYLASLQGNGAFVNNGTITTTGPAIAPAAVNTNLSGAAVTNNGTITANLTTGNYAIDEGSYGLGSLTNTGAITAIGGGGLNTYGYTFNNSGSVTADQTGLYAFDEQVINSGVIHSNGGVGAYLYGNVGTPASNSGTIYGQTVGAELDGYTLTNTGTIASPGMAVSIDPYGTLINEASGVINGEVGSALYGFTILGTLDNAGTINGAVNLADTTNSVNLSVAEATIDNEFGGVINGAVTVGNGSITNAGTINGGAQSVVFLSPSFFLAANTLTLQTGSTLVGDAVGAVGATNNLILQGTGTANNNFLNFTSLSVQASGTWTLGGTSAIGTSEVATGTLVNTGSLSTALTVDSGAAFTNSGTFTDTSGQGIQLAGGAALTNQAGGVITSTGIGVSVAGGGSVTNAGTITGGTDSVIFAGAGANTLTLQTGSTLNGTAIGSTTAGATNALVLQGTGTANNNFVNFNSLSVQASGTWTLGGTSSFGTTTVATGTLVNTGTLTSDLTVDTGAGFTNSGTFTDTSGLGVQLQSGATLTNQTGGVITGDRIGVTIADGGSVTNADAITGAMAGVYGLTSATVVKNSGTISAGASGSGVLLLAGGTVNNYAGGTISGGSNGIYSSGPATVTNAGSITSTGFGVSLGAGGGVTNQTGGVITGGTLGVINYGTGSTVSNAGSISATDATGFGVVSVGGEVANLAGGTITGGQAGVYLVGAAMLTNAGSITAKGVSYADGVVLAQGGGTLSNSATGAISGAKAGVYSAGGAATVINSGSIAATGMGGAGVVLATGGTVINNAGGAISGYLGDTIVVVATPGSNEVIRAGTPGVLLTAGGAVTNNTGGTISGYDGVAGTDAAVTVTNAGSITGTSHGVALTDGGNVNNLSGGYIVGIEGGVAGHNASLTITNAGTIKATGANSAGVALLAGGSVSNSAVIAGATGVYASGVAAMVSNGGAITGTVKHGVSLMDGGSVDNLAGGEIIGVTAGVGASGALTLTNAGTIESIAIAASSSNSAGVKALAGGSVVNQSGGVISSNDVGVYMTGAASSVTNAGSITGSAASVEFAGADANTLTLQTGSTLNGAAYGSTASGATNALTLQGTGTANNNFVAFNTLDVQATGSWTLGGTSAIGATEVSSGTLIVTGALASAFTVDSGATLQGSSASLLGNVTDNGTLVFDQASAGVFANAITGSGQLIKQDAGLLALNGVSSIAATAVNGGNLQIGDAAHASAQLTSNVTVNTGGTLSGHGTVVGNVANNGGTVSPGGTIGTLTINGNYTQTSASVLSIETTPDTSSKLVVTGTATLAGTLQFVTDPGFYRKGTQYDFLSAASVTGTFSSVTATNGATFSVSIGPNGAIVTETAGAYAPVGNATANQRAVGAAFINYPIGVSDFDPVANALIALPTAAGQNAAYDRLGGEVDADFLTVARDDVRSFLGGVEDQNAGGGSPKSGPNATWGYVTGSADTVHGDGNAHGFDQHAGGVVFGGERDLGANTRLGAAFDYSHSDFSLQGLDQNGALDTVAGGVYGRQDFGDLFLDAAASVGWETGKSTRTIAFTGVDRRATGSFDGASVGGLISFGDRIHGPDGLLIEPSISIIGSSVRQGGFTESGATGADLAVDSQTQGTAEALVGARFSKSFPMASGKLSLDGRLDWAHELSTETPTIGESFAAAAGTHFVVAGADPGKDFAVIGAGLTYSASSRLSVFVRYNGAMSSQQSDQAGTLGVKYSW